jgi:hypothetical protein
VPAGTRSSLRPRLSEGEECEQTSGASRRGNAMAYLLFEEAEEKCAIAHCASAIQDL